MSDAHDPSPTAGADHEPAPTSAAVLTPEQARILGVMVEKERTTPADYPMTANSVMRACNQTTSRSPVVSYGEQLVSAELTALKSAGLVRFVHSQSNRATKYRHVLDETWQLEDDQLAVLSLLMLRGPQTPGELRTRAERQHRFGSPSEVEQVLTGLAGRSPAMVVELERQPGQKERRWAQVLTGMPSDSELAALDAPRGGGGGRRHEADEAVLARVAALEAEVSALRVAIEELVGPIGGGGSGSEVHGDTSGSGATQAD
jgi:uncharacterized protein YceH (UPF0502 family)